MIFGAVQLGHGEVGICGAGRTDVEQGLVQLVPELLAERGRQPLAPVVPVLELRRPRTPQLRPELVHVLIQEPVQHVSVRRI